MKRLFAAGILATLSVVVWSCGTSENTREDILNLGGISSTGNKDDDPTSNEEAPRADQHGEVPTPNQAFICENPVDLSGRSYTKSSDSGLSTICSGGERVGACISTMTFVSKKEVTVSYLTDAVDGLSTEPATYSLCGTTLGIRTRETTAKGEFLTNLLRADPDLAALFDEASGLRFNLTR